MVDIRPLVLENQMEMHAAHEMETGIIQSFLGIWLSQQQGTFLGGSYNRHYGSLDCILRPPM